MSCRPLFSTTLYSFAQENKTVRRPPARRPFAVANPTDAATPTASSKLVSELPLSRLSLHLAPAPTLATCSATPMSSLISRFISSTPPKPLADDATAGSLIMFVALRARLVEVLDEAAERVARDELLAHQLDARRGRGVVVLEPLLDGAALVGEAVGLFRDEEG